jgi:hypothetical protein
MIMYCISPARRHDGAPNLSFVSNSEAETATAADEYIDRRASFSRVVS